MFGPCPALRVFIAYSHQDLECARELYNAITSHFDKNRCKVWIDEAELLAGHKWRSRIEAAIASSDIVLVCLSKKMLASRGYVHREVELALDVQKEIPDNRIYIIPVRLDDCDVPASLSNFHWANWFEDFGKRLILKTLEHTLEDKPPPLRMSVSISGMPWLVFLVDLKERRRGQIMAGGRLDGLLLPA